MKHESHLDRALQERKSQHLLRHTVERPAAGGVIMEGDRRLLNFGSNDYLDLAGNPTVLARSAEYLQRFGAGAASSRLVTGTLPCHLELERRIAQHKGYPAAVVFGSGFLTNCGTVPALVGRNDIVFADKLIHASLIDAVKISGAQLKRFRHNDPVHLAELLAGNPTDGQRLIVTEAVFSMDGDRAPLKAITELADQHKALVLVDEAHSTGVFGIGGAGLVAEHQLQNSVNLCMGTLSKGLGGYGGFVACSETMRDYLINHARGFIYTTALPPAVVGSAIGALDVLAAEPDRGAKLLERAQNFRHALQAGGLDTFDSDSPIIPIRVGENETAMRLAASLLKDGLLVIAIRPPTVPAGTARLRLSVTSAHTASDLAYAAERIIHHGQLQGIAA